jgi:hypothetical protein
VENPLLRWRLGRDRRRERLLVLTVERGSSADGTLRAGDCLRTIGGALHFERENKNPIENPSSRRIEAELRKLRSEGPSSFASLTNDEGDFLQVAGGGAGCLVERRDAVRGRQFRAYQDDPVVPFEDGTELCFSSGRVPLRPREWFRLNQAVEIFITFNEGRPLPEYVRWRDITEVLADEPDRP